jgi:hypothetical protein
MISRKLVVVVKFDHITVIRKIDIIEEGIIDMIGNKM